MTVVRYSSGNQLSRLCAILFCRNLHGNLFTGAAPSYLCTDSSLLVTCSLVAIVDPTNMFDCDSICVGGSGPCDLTTSNCVTAQPTPGPTKTPSPTTSPTPVPTTIHPTPTPTLVPTASPVTPAPTETPEDWLDGMIRALIIIAAVCFVVVCVGIGALLLLANKNTQKQPATFPPPGHTAVPMATPPTAANTSINTGAAPLPPPANGTRVRGMSRRLSISSALNTPAPQRAHGDRALYTMPANYVLLVPFQVIQKSYPLAYQVNAPAGDLGLEINAETGAIEVRIIRTQSGTKKITLTRAVRRCASRRARRRSLQTAQSAMR